MGGNGWEASERARGRGTSGVRDDGMAPLRLGVQGGV